MNIIKRKCTRLLGIAMICTIIMAATAPSHAMAAEEKGEYDYKYYPAASLCYSPQQSLFDDSRRMEFGEDGSIENPSRVANRTLQIVCPIIRDNTGTRSGMQVRVNVELVNPARSMPCRLGSRSLDGNIVYMPTSYKTKSGHGRTSFLFNLSSNQLPVGRIAILQCTLPEIHFTSVEGDGSRIISIRARENR